AQFVKGWQRCRIEPHGKLEILTHIANVQARLEQAVPRIDFLLEEPFVSLLDKSGEVLFDVASSFLFQRETVSPNKIFRQIRDDEALRAQDARFRRDQDFPDR